MVIVCTEYVGIGIDCVEKVGIFYVELVGDLQNRWASSGQKCGRRLHRKGGHRLLKLGGRFAE